MSAKRSWDIAPRAPKERKEPATQRPVRSMHDMRPRAKPQSVAVPVEKRNVTISRGRKSAPETRAPLKARRKQKKKVRSIALVVLLALLLIGALAALWIPSLRMHEVRASGPHAEETREIALAAISGTQYLLIPRNSIFFIPERDIRARILAAHPDIQAVSLSADGLNTLTLAAVPRAQAFVWCGPSREAPLPSCYDTNAEGLVFAVATASSTAALKVYAPLAEGNLDAPLGAHIVSASFLPNAFRFVRAMHELNAGVKTLVMRGDEADLYTEGGTRITYVLGREQLAAATAASIFPQLNLNDGSILYVDLRFEGKGYFMRAGGE